MRLLIARYRRAFVRRQEGWALMDAMMSSVLIVFAFVGTFTAIDASTRTAERDVRRTASYDIAQNEMDRLRKQGDRNITTLLGEDRTSTPKVNPAAGQFAKKVTVSGNTYWVWTRAYYTTGIDPTLTDACGSSSNPTGAQFVYLSVSVTWDGMPAIQDTPLVMGENGKPVSTPATRTTSLDAYYAPEGGDLQTNTSTLMVYVQDRLGAPLNNRIVGLYKTSTGIQIGSNINTNSSGCVLFTALPRDDYEIRVTTGASEYDLYTKTSPSVTPVKVTSRSSLIRTIKLSTLTAFTPAFQTQAPAAFSAVPETVTVGSSTLANSLAGPWTVTAPELLSTVSPDFLNKYAFLPLSTVSNKLFPLQNGYTAWAGPCDINDPDDSNAGNGAERVTIPSTADAGSWPLASYTGKPALWLPNLRIRVQPPSGTLYSGQIQVRLVDKAGGGATGNCGSRQATHFNTWIRLPGVVGTTGTYNGYLANTVYALPEGRYDVCTRRNFSASSSSTKYYELLPGIDNNYPGPSAVTTSLPNSTTVCGDSALWT